MVSYACYGVTNADRGKTGAVIECVVPYAFHTITDSDRGQTRAEIESILSYACYGVCYVIIGDSSGDVNCTNVFVRIFGYFGFFYLCYQVVVDAVNFDCFGKCVDARKQAKA